VAPPPTTGLVSNYNYFLGDGGSALANVEVTVNIDVDLISSANGWSFQLNGYSTEAPDITTEWQQYVIYLEPNSTELWARIDTWSGTADSDELNRIDVQLANLPSETVKAGYTFTFKLNYDGDTVVGATYTVADETGKSLGDQTITIVDPNNPHLLRTTGKPATTANLAPVAAFQFNIGGDGGSTTATFTGGAGTITYASSNVLTATSTEPSYTDFDDGTAENGNLIFCPLPETANRVITQSFEATTVGAPSVPAPAPAGKPAPRTRQLPRREPAPAPRTRQLPPR